MLLLQVQCTGGCCCSREALHAVSFTLSHGLLQDLQKQTQVIKTLCESIRNRQTMQATSTSICKPHLQVCCVHELLHVCHLESEHCQLC